MKAFEETTRNAKRELGEIVETRKASRGSSPETMRPSKSRKTKYRTTTTTTTSTKDLRLVEDDPVSLARKALEMFQKEVEDDEDYTVPDKSPAAVEDNVESPDTRSKDMSTSSTKIKEADASLKSSSDSGQLSKSSSKQIDKGTTSAWQKASRASMFSDDPSIL
jgi:hypothetical protein